MSIVTVFFDFFSSQFNATREVAQYAVQAAQAYRTIVESIAEADIAARAAKKASEEAYRMVRLMRDLIFCSHKKKTYINSRQILLNQINL